MYIGEIDNPFGLVVVWEILGLIYSILSSKLFLNIIRLVYESNVTCFILFEALFFNEKKFSKLIDWGRSFCSIMGL